MLRGMATLLPGFGSLSRAGAATRFYGQCLLQLRINADAGRGPLRSVRRMWNDDGVLVMTTVAYRDGVMASDSGAWVSGATVTGVVKVARGSDGTLHGVSGLAGPCCSYIEWVRNDGRAEYMPRPLPRNDEEGTFIALVAAEGKPLVVRTARGDEFYDMPYLSIGSGAVGALCAMHAGATATDAIEAAIAHAEGAIGPVQWVSRAALTPSKTDGGE